MTDMFGKCSGFLGTWGSHVKAARPGLVKFDIERRAKKSCTETVDQDISSEEEFSDFM